MNNTISITVRNNYGVETYYPYCKTAKTFAEMLQTKTLTPVALMHIKRLGYNVFIVDTNPVPAFLQD